MTTIVTAELRVRKYSDWKSTFERNRTMRASFHASNERIYCSPDDDNRLCIVMDFPSQQEADRFIHSDELRKAQQEAGVEGKPLISVSTVAPMKAV